MLKKLIIILFTTLTLVGCRPKSVSEDETLEFSIASYYKIPSLSLISLIKDNENIDILSDIDSLNSSFDSNEKDIIIAPLNTGVNKCLSNDNYKLLSIITYSTYLVYSTDETFNKGDVGVYEKGVIETVLDKLSTDLSSYNFVYYDSYNALKDDLINGDIEAVLVDKLDYADINNSVSLTAIEDINETYQKEYSYSQFPTYGIFVSNDVSKNRQTDLATFSRLLRNSISQYKSDTTTLENALKDVDVNAFGYSDKDLIISNYNDCGIEFAYAVDVYDEISTLLSLFDIDISESIIVQ